MLRAGDVAEATARAVAAAVSGIRARPLAKPPGIAEAVEWANAATILEKGGSPWPEAFRRAIGVLIKDEEDLTYLAPELGRIVEEAAGVSAAPEPAARPRRFLGFGRLLRRYGFAVAPEQVVGFMQARDVARAALDGRYPRGGRLPRWRRRPTAATNSRRMFQSHFYGDAIRRASKATATRKPASRTTAARDEERDRGGRARRKAASCRPAPNS